MITLFIRIELPCSSVRRRPQNRAYGVAVFEGSHIRYNIATREATVSCSTTFFEKWNTFFMTLPHALLWQYGASPEVRSEYILRKKFHCAYHLIIPFKGVGRMEIASR